MLLIAVKFLMIFTLVFFSYVIYLSFKERKQFFKSVQYESTSLFEKIVLNAISFFGFAFYLCMLVVYSLFMFT